MSLHAHFRILGVLLALLALLHAFFPARFNWRAELSGLSLLNRQIFMVHTFFIALIVLLFGLLSLFFADELLARTPLARAILAGWVAFWAARWVAQLFVYDPRLWRGKRFETATHVFFICLWTYCVVVYGWALIASLTARG